MSTLETAISHSEKELTSRSIPLTGIVHRFRSPIEYISIKSSEIGASMSNILKTAFDRTKIVIEEGCFNRLCGAPPSAHVMASA